MFLDLIQNFWLGFIITATPGAVLLEAIRRSLNPSLHVVRFLLGNFLGMLMVITLTLIGASVLQDSIAGSIFFVISGLLLLYIGYTALVINPQKTQAIRTSKASAPLSTGFILAVANPLSFVFWLSLIGGFRSEDNAAMTVFSIISVVLGALMVFAVIVLLSKRLRRLLTPRREIILSRVLGIIIIFYGLAVLFKSLG